MHGAVGGREGAGGRRRKGGMQGVGVEGGGGGVSGPAMVGKLGSM